VFSGVKLLDASVTSKQRQTSGQLCSAILPEQGQSPLQHTYLHAQSQMKTEQTWLLSLKAVCMMHHTPVNVATYCADRASLQCCRQRMCRCWKMLCANSLCRYSTWSCHCRSAACAANKKHSLDCRNKVSSQGINDKCADACKLASSQPNMAHQQAARRQSACHNT